MYVFVHVSTQNLLALGSEDRTMTISNCEGDTLRTVSCNNVYVYYITNQEQSVEKNTILHVCNVHVLTHFH